MVTLCIPCFALSRDQAAIGGVGAGCSLEYVQSIYGMPDHDSGSSYNYGGKFWVFYRHGIVKSVSCSESNLATPAGVTVGMSEMVLNDVYGKAGAIQKQGKKTLYIYPANGVALTFTVEKGIIASIDCGEEE